MFNRYFQQELANLKELGAEFSRAHPAVAPMLSGHSTDPDVERLLEGVAFLTGLLREKLDDEFPEIIHELVHLIWPHYLRAVPSTSIIAFTPKNTVKQSMIIPAGVQLASVPIEGVSCLFQTCFKAIVHPLELLDAAFVESSGRLPAIILKFKLQGLTLSDWHSEKLRLFIAGDLAVAADIYYLLRNFVREINITPNETGQGIILPPENLKPVGFEEEQSLIPYPSNSFPGYRILQEYFILPEKFMFLDLIGMDHWQERGQGDQFEIRFELKKLPFIPPRIKKENFVLSATPIINIFPFDATPVRMDHRKTEYQLHPSGTNENHFQIYTIEKVTGFRQGTAGKREYQPFELFSDSNGKKAIYRVTTSKSRVRSGLDHFLSVSHPDDENLHVTETLSIKLQCTNGFLAEKLQTGDIRVPTSTSPQFVEFSNIRPPTTNTLPPLGNNLLWRLLSHLSLNYVSLSSVENLSAMLKLYLFEDSRDRAMILANHKRIDGLEDVTTVSRDRIINGIIMRGQEIKIRTSLDHFAGQGDLYLFGSILDYFMGSYASINTYTRLVFNEVIKGKDIKWPARIGDRLLV